MCKCWTQEKSHQQLSLCSCGDETERFSWAASDRWRYSRWSAWEMCCINHCDGSWTCCRDDLKKKGQGLKEAVGRPGLGPLPETWCSRLRGKARRKGAQRRRGSERNCLASRTQGQNVFNHRIRTVQQKLPRASAGDLTSSCNYRPVLSLHAAVHHN